MGRHRDDTTLVACRIFAGIVSVPCVSAILTLTVSVAVPAPARAAPDQPAARVPVPPPLPPERPRDLDPPPPASEPLRSAPPPPERPADLRTDRPTDPGRSETAPVPDPSKLSEPPLPPARPQDLSGANALALKVAAPDDTACRIRLTRLGVAFEPLPALENGQCGAPLPLKLTALGDGIGLPQTATLTCIAAEGLARWATEVRVVAERELKTPVRSIVIGTSYECRGQNHDVDAKLSEHAFANGIDVMSFGFEGRAPIAVAAQAPGSDEGRFLDAVRGKACGMFRTVLGPGTNAAHANHFHLDERERSGGHRLCE